MPQLCSCCGSAQVPKFRMKLQVVLSLSMVNSWGKLISDIPSDLAREDGLRTSVYEQERDQKKNKIAPSTISNLCGFEGLMVIKSNKNCHLHSYQGYVILNREKELIHWVNNCCLSE